jgi:hypothetical protein
MATFGEERARRADDLAVREQDEREDRDEDDPPDAGRPAEDRLAELLHGAGPLARVRADRPVDRRDHISRYAEPA